MTIALVITHASPEAFLHSVDVWLSQLDELLVVDNGSSPQWRETVCKALEPRQQSVQFLFNEQNLGIAVALNKGFSRLMERGFESAFVFDQDSLPLPGMISEMLEIYEHHPSRDRIAIVAPNRLVDSAGIGDSFLVPSDRFRFRRVQCTSQRSLDNVSIVISSGGLYNISALRQLGSFREDFFIDYVDTEYCLRARRTGYQIVVACKARLDHRLGDQKAARLGPLTMHPTFHGPLRWYYISRNRVPMMRTYALRWPHWFLYELLINSYGLIRLILFEDHKVAKALAIVLGTWDGLTNRMGPASAARVAALRNDDHD